MTTDSCWDVVPNQVPRNVAIQLPSLFTMLAFLEYEYGIFHPIGGLGSVSERMASIAKDLGVTFRMNEAVESVIMTANHQGRSTASGERR